MLKSPTEDEVAHSLATEEKSTVLQRLVSRPETGRISKKYAAS